MDRGRLLNYLNHNVMVISFIRRSDPKGILRRMVCTKSNIILSSLQGHTILNFRAPKYGGPKLDEVKNNLIVVWDILTQDYRLIPCESVSVIEIIPEDKFWTFYNETLKNMSKRDKVTFMNTDWKY